MAQAKKFVLTFVNRIQQSPHVISFYFSTSTKFSFQAGQYLQMTLPHDDVDEGGASRFFTMASAPHEPHIMITTKQSSSSFKQKLFALKKGDQVRCFGPMGTFVLEEL